MARTMDVDIRIERQEKKILKLKDQLDQAQEEYDRLMELKRESDKKKIVAAFDKSKRSLTEKELSALDKKIQTIEAKVSKAKAEYDALVDQLSDLIEQRYPERREEAIKERLYQAYRGSNKTVDFIVDFIENADDEDDYWAS